MTLTAQYAQDTFLAKNAGTQESAKYSIGFVKSLADREPSFDPGKSFKEPYKDTQKLRYR